MLLEALAAVSLHCSLTEWDYFPNRATSAPFAAQVYLDYDRNYAFMQISHADTPGSLETNNAVATDADVRFLDGGWGFNRIEDAKIDRTTGVFTMRLKAPMRDGYKVDFRGTCQPGEPITLPPRPVARF